VHRHLAALTSWPLALSLAVYPLLTVFLQFGLPLQFASSPDPVSGDCPAGPMDPDVVSEVLTAVAISALVALVLKLRVLTEDVFRVRSELQRTASLAAARLVLWLSAGFAGGRGPRGAFDHSSLELGLVWAWYGLFWANGLLAPLAHMWSAARARLRGTGTGSLSPTNANPTIAPLSPGIAVPPELQTLPGLLNSKPGRLSFEQHLVREFSYVRVLFLLVLLLPSLASLTLLPRCSCDAQD
jgi:hypothetical protein